MAITVEDILGAGMGPVRQTFMDTQPQSTGVPAPPAGGAPSTPAAEATPTSTPAPATAATVTGEATGVAEPAKTLSPPETDSQHQGPRASTDRTREVTGVENVAVTDTEQTQTVSARQQTPPRMSYVELYQRLNPYHPPTEEDLEKERKKQKRESIFAAIGDGISALSNLFFTTQYAPNAYDPSKGMTAVTRARWDKLKKEREANHREYMEGFMRAMQMDDATARDDRNWQHTVEREKVTDHYKEAADARAQAKADRDAAMAQLRMDLMQGKIDQQEAAAEAKRIEADYADAYWQSRINKNNYRRPIGSGSRGNSGSGMKRYPAYNPTTGETITITAKDSKHAWSQCPQGFTIRQEPSSSESTRTTQNGRRTTTSTTTTKKNGNDNLDGPRKNSKKPNPMEAGGNTGSRKQKKKNPMS